MSSFFGDMFGGGSTIASSMNKANNRTTEKTNSGMSDIYKSFAGFSPGFYQQAGNVQMMNQLPALQQRGHELQQAGDFGFANRGLATSSAANNYNQSLSRMMQQGQTGVTQQALEYQQALQQLVEQERARMQQQLQQGLSTDQLMQQSYGIGGQAGTPSPMQPLGGLFNGLGNVGMMFANTRKN